MKDKLLIGFWFLPLVLAGVVMASFPGKANAEPDVVSGEMTIEVTIDAPAGNRDTRLWVPLPVSDSFQKIENVKIEGNYTTQGKYKEKETGNNILYAEWTKPADGQRMLALSFRATVRPRVNRDFVETSSPLPADIRQYVKETAFIPTGGEVKKVGDKVGEGKTKISEKARAAYDWVVDNTFRDPSVQGCGIGDVEQTLAKKGGKCVDISSVFVSVARAAGVPAREVFGIRLGKDDGVSDMTKGHHCWAEYYAPGTGWVPVDPADQRKMVFEKKLDDKSDEAAKYREYYFNGLDPYRIAVATGGRGYFLNPRQKSGPLNYFMYPFAEVDGKAVEWLAAQKELKYKITFKKL